MKCGESDPRTQLREQAGGRYGPQAKIRPAPKQEETPRPQVDLARQPLPAAPPLRNQEAKDPSGRRRRGLDLYLAKYRIVDE